MSENDNKSFKSFDKLEYISTPDLKISNIEGQILGGRYRVMKFLDKGKNGLVYEAVDTKKTRNQKLVIKIQEVSDIGLEEIKTLL